MKEIQETMPAIEVKLGHNNKWSITSGNAVLAPALASKQVAIDVGRILAKKWGERLVIHGRYGQIFRGEPLLDESRETKIRNAIRKVGKLPNPNNNDVQEIVNSIMGGAYVVKPHVTKSHLNRHLNSGLLSRVSRTKH